MDIVHQRRWAQPHSTAFRDVLGVFFCIKIAFKVIVLLKTWLKTVINYWKLLLINVLGVQKPDHSRPYLIKIIGFFLVKEGIPKCL